MMNVGTWVEHVIPYAFGGVCVSTKGLGKVSFSWPCMDEGTLGYKTCNSIHPFCGVYGYGGLGKAIEHGVTWPLIT
jgi:hypothetical protein